MLFVKQCPVKFQERGVVAWARVAATAGRAGPGQDDLDGVLDTIQDVLVLLVVGHVPESNQHLAFSQRRLKFTCLDTNLTDGHHTSIDK